MPLHADLYLDRIDLARYAPAEMCDVCHVDSLDELVARLRAGKVCAGACPHWTPERLEAFRLAVSAEEYVPQVPSLDVPRPAEVGLLDLNDPDADSPLLVTSNSKLTHQVVLTVLSTMTRPMWMLSVDAGGHTVDMSMVYKTLTPEGIAESIQSAGRLPPDFSGPVILPGLAEPIAEPLADTLGRPVTVGPICIAELPLFLEKWDAALLPKRVASPFSAGDLILVRTSGLAYSLGRRLSRNSYDHVAVVVRAGQTLNIVHPSAVLVPIEHIVKPNRSPLILRPGWDTPSQAIAFVQAMEELRECSYDLRRALKGVVLVMLRTWLGIRLTMSPLRENADRWICTEAILINLQNALPGFREINRLPLDYSDLGFATTNDLLRIASARPDLLRIVT